MESLTRLILNIIKNLLIVIAVFVLILISFNVGSSIQSSKYLLAHAKGSLSLKFMSGS